MKLHFGLLFLILWFGVLTVEAAPRQCVLVEEFTNSGCSACSLYNPGIRTVITAMTRDTCVSINYHAWWPSTDDPFYQWNAAEAQARTNYYGVWDVPALFVDYLLQPDMSQADSLSAAIRARYAVSSPCTLSVAAAMGTGNTFRFVASVTADEAMTGSDNRLFVALVNDVITYSTPPGPNGELSFPEPFRDVYPDASTGQGFSLAAGQTYHMAGTLNANSFWPLGNCTVIAYVQNVSTREILQATWKHIGSSSGTISLTAPNGGEQWYAGESHTITWTSGLTTTMNIELLRDSTTGAWETIAANVPNTGSYTWTVTSPGSAAARIRLSGATQMLVADTSAAVFSIGGVAVTMPNGGETWTAGDVDTIRWLAPAMTEAVRVELNRTYPGGAWETIAASTPNSGMFPWTVTTPLSTAARLRVQGTVHPLAGDTSNASFTLTARQITLTAPNGGETYVAGQTGMIRWTSLNLSGSVDIHLNRNYPTGSWELIGSNLPDSGSYAWHVLPPGSVLARIRVTSEVYPSAMDFSATNFVIQEPNLAPVLRHTPLHDITPHTGTVVANAYDPGATLSIASVKMFYRKRGLASFDSLLLPATANYQEYSASLASLTEGTYDYYLRAADDGGLTAFVPANAPTGLYRFNVYSPGPQTLAYDDGTAESFNWVTAPDSLRYQWAVKFGPVTTPYALCGAQIAISRRLPEQTHTPIKVTIYAADGPGGLPGTVIYSRLAGSVGNVVGGLPTGTNWTTVTFKDTLGTAPIIRVPEFYIAVANNEFGSYEAFGRDANGARNHRSYFFDACENHWHSEDDSVVSTNAHPGNRMIRANGAPFGLTAYRNGNDVVLRWANLGAPHYRVYSSATPSGPFNTLEGTAATNSYTIVNGANTNAIRFYEVSPIAN
ncbi:MAG TPA: Ser-Thr-rich GPI-anchored membrane family protein [bacterium]